MNVFSGIWNFWHYVDAQYDVKDIYVHLKDGRSAILDCPSWDEQEDFVECKYINYSDNDSAKNDRLEVDQVVWATVIDSDERYKIQSNWRYRKFRDDATDCNFPNTFSFLRGYGVCEAHTFEHVIATGRQVSNYGEEEKAKERISTIMKILHWDYGLDKHEKAKRLRCLLEKIAEDIEVQRNS